VEQAILKEGPDTVCAVIAEPVMGAGGVIVAAPTISRACARSAIAMTCC